MYEYVLAQFDLSAFGSVVTALTTIVLAVLTYKYVRLTRDLLTAQTHACVVVRVVQDSWAPQILLLVIENVGKGVAYDVRFVSDRPVPSHAYGIEGPQSPARHMKDGAFITGIPALGPGDRRIFSWGQFGGLRHALGDKPLKIEASYSTDSGKLSSRLRTTSYVDIDSFEGTDANDRDSVSECAKELEKIRKQLEDWGRWSSPLRVHVVDVEREQQKAIEMRDKARARRAVQADTSETEPPKAK